jgi:hypothetical protein
MKEPAMGYIDIGHHTLDHIVKTRESAVYYLEKIIGADQQDCNEWYSGQSLYSIQEWEVKD